MNSTNIPSSESEKNIPSDEKVDSVSLPETQNGDIQKAMVLHIDHYQKYRKELANWLRSLRRKGNEGKKLAKETLEDERTTIRYQMQKADIPIAESNFQQNLQESLIHSLQNLNWWQAKDIPETAHQRKVTLDFKHPDIANALAKGLILYLEENQMYDFDQTLVYITRYKIPLIGIAFEDKIKIASLLIPKFLYLIEYMQWWDIEFYCSFAKKNGIALIFQKEHEQACKEVKERLEKLEKDDKMMDQLKALYNFTETNGIFLYWSLSLRDRFRNGKFFDYRSKI